MNEDASKRRVGEFRGIWCQGRGSRRKVSILGREVVSQTQTRAYFRPHGCNQEERRASTYRFARFVGSDSTAELFEVNNRRFLAVRE
jgi:hypothetical protein